MDDWKVSLMLTQNFDDFYSWFIIISLPHGPSKWKCPLRLEPDDSDYLFTLNLASTAVKMLVLLKV